MVSIDSFWYILNDIFRLSEDYRQKVFNLEKGEVTCRTDRPYEYKLEHFKILNLNKQLKKIEKELKELGYQEDSVCQVDKCTEFGGKSSKMVGLMQNFELFS